MSKSKLEYIWLDGYQPTASLRSKTKIVNNFSGKLEDCPIGHLMDHLRDKQKVEPLTVFSSLWLSTQIQIVRMGFW